MNDLEQHVLEAIMARPGQQAKHIAAQLGVDRKLVNSALYGSLRSKVQQDKSYLDCLRHDDIGGVSEFAAWKYGDPNYVEIQALPVSNGDAGDPFDTEAGRKLLGRLRRDRYQKTVFLGYPVRLSLIRGRRGWEGFVVQPLLLFPFQEADSRCGNPTLVDDLPQLNFRALRALSNAGDTGLMEEAIQLADELGLSNAAGDQPDLDELVARLREIRPDWDWQEVIDPAAGAEGASEEVGAVDLLVATIGSS